MNNKKKWIASGILTIIAIIYTFLVKIIDVRLVNNTKVGFATVNESIFKLLGESNFWYKLTEVLGVVALLVAGIYGIIGLIELIKRKSLFKVDKEIIMLGLYYGLVIGLYVFFEKVIINYRPILIDGALEASYPSSHTLMTLCICGSAILVNKKLFNNSKTKIINILLALIMAIMVIGRLLSGVHWFTDIVGGVLIASATLMLYYTLITKNK